MLFPPHGFSIFLQSESALQKHLPANRLPCLMAYGLEILDGLSRQPGAGVSIVVKLLSRPHPGWKYWRVQARSWWPNLELVSQPGHRNGWGSGILTRICLDYSWNNSAGLPISTSALTPLPTGRQMETHGRAWKLWQEIFGFSFCLFFLTSFQSQSTFNDTSKLVKGSLIDST